MSISSHKKGNAVHTFSVEHRTKLCLVMAIGYLAELPGLTLRTQRTKNTISATLWHMFLCFAQMIVFAWTNQQRHCLIKVCDQVDGKVVSTISFLYIYKRRKRKQTAAEFLQHPQNSACLDRVQRGLNCTPTYHIESAIFF